MGCFQALCGIPDARVPKSEWFGQRVRGLKRRAEEIARQELAVAPELVPIFPALFQDRSDIVVRIAARDGRIWAISR
ncbi:hypothetical protein AYJ57_25375 (plasmid) [Salipiger sp. CCB-MM3]|nr:hypothetical protein AYJ57_25375 [Salipiger sp. CCB-MM3]